MRKVLVLLVSSLIAGCHAQSFDAQCPRAPAPVTPEIAPEIAPQIAPQAAVDPAPAPAAPAVAEDQPEYVDVPAAPPGDSVSSVEVFYTELSPYGTFSHDPEYGRVFIPARADYTPYTNGHWVYTSAGYTWIDDDPFGWAVSHYGRWVYKARWIWVPDVVWGPAWVEWRVADGYVGWAPLPATARVATTYVTPIYAWRFVEPRAVFEIDLRSRYAPIDRVPAIARVSRPVKRYARTSGGVVYAAGPSPEFLRAKHHVTVQKVTPRERDMGRLGARDHRASPPPPAPKPAQKPQQISPPAAPPAPPIPPRRTADQRAPRPARKR